MLYGIAVPASAHGIWTQPLQALNWSVVSGASEAPKSTVRFVIAWMPPPEPIGAVLDRVVEGAAERRRPDRDERRDERAAGAR